MDPLELRPDSLSALNGKVVCCVRQPNYDEPSDTLKAQVLRNLLQHTSAGVQKLLCFLEEGVSCLATEVAKLGCHHGHNRCPQKVCACSGALCHQEHCVFLHVNRASNTNVSARAIQLKLCASRGKLACACMYSNADEHKRQRLKSGSIAHWLEHWLEQNAPTTFHPHGYGFCSSPGNGLGQNTCSKPELAAVGSGVYFSLTTCSTNMVWWVWAAHVCVTPTCALKPIRSETDHAAH